MQPVPFRRNLSLLRVANLIRVSGGESPGRVESYHDRVREAVQASVAPW